jgi:hypothetical protein
LDPQHFDCAQTAASQKFQFFQPQKAVSLSKRRFIHFHFSQETRGQKAHRIHLPLWLLRHQGKHNRSPIARSPEHFNKRHSEPQAQQLMIIVCNNLGRSSLLVDDQIDQFGHEGDDVCLVAEVVLGLLAVSAAQTRLYESLL